MYAAGVLHIAGAGVRRSEPLRGRVGRGHRVTVRRAERVHDDDLRAGPDGADIRRRRLPGGVRGHRLPGDLCVPAELASAQPAPLVDTIESDDRIERIIEASARNTAAGNNNATCFGKLASPCGTIRVPPHSTQIDGQSPSHLVPGKLRQLGPDLSQQTSQKDEWFV